MTYKTVMEQEGLPLICEISLLSVLLHLYIFKSLKLTRGVYIYSFVTSTASIVPVAVEVE